MPSCRSVFSDSISASNRSRKPSAAARWGVSALMATRWPVCGVGRGVDRAHAAFAERLVDDVGAEMRELHDALLLAGGCLFIVTAARASELASTAAARMILRAGGFQLQAGTDFVNSSAAHCRARGGDLPMFRPRYFVRSIYIVVAASGAFAVAPCRCSYAEAAPYEARVVATGAAVHSGPGDKFYPTDTLAQGEVVEIYREKSGGWLGIRPPANSFSWISAADLDMREGNLAVVNKDDVASRIGSRLNAKRNAAQVRLKKGEVVEVIDDETIGEERWCKIAPPAGEFRWIQASLVERLSGVQMVSAETAVKDDAAAPPLISTTRGRR